MALSQFELTDENVNEVFIICAADRNKKGGYSKIITVNLYNDGSEGALEFYEYMLEELKDNIEYMFGQLDCVHAEMNTIYIKDLAIKSDGNPWIKNKATFMKFLYLGIGCGFITPVDKQNGTTRLRNIRPTFAKNDPRYAEWWKLHHVNWGITDDFVTYAINNIDNITPAEFEYIMDHYDELTMKQQDDINAAQEARIDRLLNS